MIGACRVLGLLFALVGILQAEVIEQTVTYQGVKFRVVRVAPQQVQLVWKDPKGTPYREFSRVQAAFKGRGKTVKFIMNAGIFEPGGIPSGLHIEQQKKQHPLNLADAPGNFFLKPNGVIWIEGGDRLKAGIATSSDFSRLEKEITLNFAAQSGPMLLIDGKRHPTFIEDSASKLIRNGVGIDSDHQVVFAITAKGQTINLWDFAGLFLHLGCRNALFLDGDISQMAVNPMGPVKSNLFGAMFVVTE